MRVYFCMCMCVYFCMCVCVCFLYMCVYCKQMYVYMSVLICTPQLFFLFFLFFFFNFLRFNFYFFSYSFSSYLYNLANETAKPFLPCAFFNPTNPTT